MRTSSGQPAGNWALKLIPPWAKGKLIDEIFGEKVEPHLVQPTFIMDYPVEMSPLVQKAPHQSGSYRTF